MMQPLTRQQEDALKNLLSRLIDQEQARIVAQPYQSAPGFWFGGGNLVQEKGGTIWLSGRYRNFGDARTGLKGGERGLECALFCSDNGGQSFKKNQSWSKADLSSPDRNVLSIEGTALHMQPDGSWELFISSEKEVPYPPAVADYQKAGTGVWSIDRITGKSPNRLKLSSLTPVLENHAYPEYLHLKDPVIFDSATGETMMLFCSHPFTWASSNTGMALRSMKQEEFQVQYWEIVSRGPSWDVAATRITSRLAVPQLGLFAKVPPCAVYFYDGAECLRSHEENQQARKRPRGYSCEELGGAFFGWDSEFPQLMRLSRLEPLFISPWGTGSSRYVDTLVTRAGILAVWQQSQADLSQPLVSHFLPMAEVERILAGGS
jgi:hypothetical protein